MGKRKKSRKQRRREKQQRETRLKRMRWAGFIVLAIAIIGGLVAWRNAGRPSGAIVATTPPNLDGPVDAPVRVVEYGDFGCHACRQWHNLGIKEQLKSRFGEQVSFEFRHFPVITAQSPTAAEAGQCAAEQGQFWAYHDYIYEQTPQGALSTPDLKSYAAAIGLDQAQFDSCLDSDKYEPVVNRHWQQARDAGARGTPTFLVNGQQAFPGYEGLAAAIEQELAN